ncbi:MAG: hypothetical protein QM689_09870 [Oscillospiraceae bacterium]
MIQFPALAQTVAHSLAQASDTAIYNVYTPLPYKTHMIFCCLATLLYAFQFSRKRKFYYLLMLIAIDLTIVTQFTDKESTIHLLGAAEAVLLIAAFVVSRIDARKAKARTAALAQEEQARAQIAADNENAERAFERAEFIDHAFDEKDSPDENLKL